MRRQNFIWGTSKLPPYERGQVWAEDQPTSSTTCWPSTWPAHCVRRPSGGPSRSWLCSEFHRRKTSLDRTLARFLLACSLDWRRALNVLRANRAELLFEVFSQCYERGSILVTTNLPFDEWTEVFGSETLTGALLDRLTHHVHILEMNGESYRLRQSRQAAALLSSD